ncbi:hypothetical protein CVS40_9774 [Lucilia cuprina]|nr:hypothetical protein CVS40_9774 [Lucilia cuprina]
MMFSSGKYAKYICLIVIVLMQLALPAAALKCIQCGGEAKCSTTMGEEAKDCPSDGKTYTKCFTQIDTSGNISRGCKTAEEVATCTADNNCILSDERKNNQLICKKCDATDEKCSQTDMNVNDLKYNQICGEGVKKCIKKIDNKLVVRGCATDSDISQCTDAKTCETCDSVMCNTGVFPKERIRCHQCTGSSCLDVAANSLVAKPCTNYVENDQCYTKAKSETDMTRGCKSDTKDNQCTDTAEGCAFCSSDNCNYLKYKYDQVLKCHQCTGDDATNECFKEQTSTEFKDCKKQLLYNEAEYCYTQINGDKIQRGCLHDNADLTADKCTDSNNCKKCNSANGCNNAKEEPPQFTCIVCRSDLNEKCWNDAKTMQGQKCRVRPSSAKEGCFHGIWNGVAIRGCMVDASLQNQEICKDEKNLQCRACYESNCNTFDSSGANKIGLQFAVLIRIQLFSRRLVLFDNVLKQLALTTVVGIKCIQCGDSDEACNTSGNIIRGCKTDDEAKACTADNNCIITGERKNNQLICKKCIETDEKCSQSDMNFNDVEYNHICVEGVRRCIKKVDNKLVTRDCASETDICTDSKTCETCDSVNCNTGVFPKDRITCYQCTGSSCEDVTANNIAYKPCANYVENDQCYMKAKNENEMIRGCKSDTRDNECSDAAEGCVFCSDNNCNNLKYIYDQVLKCHQCTSDVPTNECFKEQTSEVFEKCKRQINYTLPEYCYTQINGNVIKRGCLHDNLDLNVDICRDVDSDTCMKCNDGDGCNSKQQILD